MRIRIYHSMTTSVRTPQHDFPHDLVGTVIFGTEGRLGIAANVTSHSVIVDPSPLSVLKASAYIDDYILKQTDFERFRVAVDTISPNRDKATGPLFVCDARQTMLYMYAAHCRCPFTH